MYKALISLILACLLFSPKLWAQKKQKTYSQYIVLPADIPVPPAAEKIGTISSDRFLNCVFDRVLTELKLKVRGMGGNMVKITKYTTPAMFKPQCYKLQAEVYNCDEQTLHAISDSISSKMKADMPSNADYALLYIYKPKTVPGQLGSSSVKVNGKKVSTIRSNQRKVVKLYEAGETRIKSGRVSIDVDVAPGNVYFLRYYDEVLGPRSSSSSVTLMPPELGYWEYIQMTIE